MLPQQGGILLVSGGFLILFVQYGFIVSQLLNYYFMCIIFWDSDQIFIDSHMTKYFCSTTDIFRDHTNIKKSWMFSEDCNFMVIAFVTKYVFFHIELWFMNCLLFARVWVKKNIHFKSRCKCTVSFILLDRISSKIFGELAKSLPLKTCELQHSCFYHFVTLHKQ